MKLLVRCLWMPPPNASLESRLAEIAHIGMTNELLACVGPRWYKLGRSRVNALKHEVHLGELHKNPTCCRHIPLIEGESYWTLDVWNGRSDLEVANLHFTLFDPPNDQDIFFVSLERESLGGKFLWNDLLSAVRQLANGLGGQAIVTSHQLQEEAARQKLAGAEQAAYAAFWGQDRSSRNPLYRWFSRSGRKPPTEIVACDSWEDLSHLDAARMQAITETLAMVAARIGEE